MGRIQKAKIVKAILGTPVIPMWQRSDIKTDQIAYSGKNTPGKYRLESIKFKMTFGNQKRHKLLYKHRQYLHNRV